MPTLLWFAVGEVGGLSPKDHSEQEQSAKWVACGIYSTQGPYRQLLEPTAKDTCLPLQQAKDQSTEM